MKKHLVVINIVLLFGLFTSSSYATFIRHHRVPTPTNTECRIDDITPTPTQAEPTITPTIDLTITPEATPEPTVSEVSTPQTWFGFFGYSSTETPQCNDGSPIILPTNPHVYRKDSQAIVKWVPTQGDKVHIYYSRNGSQVWEHSLSDQPNNGFATINLLDPKIGYTFAIQQAQGCAGGETVLAVIVDPPAREWSLFSNATWTWAY